MKTSAVFSLVLASASSLANGLPNAVINNNNNKHAADWNTPNGEVGAVFALTNEAADNKVVAFSRNADGILTEAGTYSTGGNGIGVDFDTQGGLQLNADNSFLYAVSPGSDVVSVFSVKGSKLKKVQTVYAGDQPLSISLSSTGFAYVLDGSVASTGIFGFKVNKSDGTLTPITNQTIPLSSPIGVPGVVTFSPDGGSLAVTNKVGSTIDVFSVDKAGQATGPVTFGSSGLRPFAATFNKDNLYVIESGLPAIMNAAVSTYKLSGGSAPSLSAITRSERNDQTDGCWIVITPDNKWLYTANFVSSSISSYSVGTDGSVKLINGTAALPGKASEPVDLALSKDGAFLYNLLRGSGAVVGFKIQADGSLKQVGGLVGQGHGLPANNGASGLAAF